MGKRDLPNTAARWPAIAALLISLFGLYVSQRNHDADATNARIAALEAHCWASKAMQEQ